MVIESSLTIQCNRIGYFGCIHQQKAANYALQGAAINKATKSHSENEANQVYQYSCVCVIFSFKFNLNVFILHLSFYSIQHNVCVSLQVKLSMCRRSITYLFIHQVKNISKKNLELEFCHAILANTIRITIMRNIQFLQIYSFTSNARTMLLCALFV